MVYERITEQVEAIQARNVSGVTDGTWLVNPRNGSGPTVLMTDSEFKAHFRLIAAASEEVTNPGRRTLEVPPPRASWTGKTIHDRVLSVVTATPMNAAQIAEAIHRPVARTRTVLSRMAKAGALTTKRGSGLYAIGRVTR